MQVQDITDRKKAEESLRVSEEKYKSLAENVDSVLMRYDKDLRVVYLSPKAEEITGITTEEFTGKTNREVGMPEDLCNLWENAISKVFQTGETETLEFGFPTDDGERTFYLKLSPEFNSDGSVGYVLGISTDITKRKQAEVDLAVSEEKYRTLHDTMRDAFVSVNMDGQIVEFNDIFQNMVGYNEEELYNFTYIDLTPEKWYEMESDIVDKQIIPRGFSDVYEKEYIRKDGTVFPVELKTFLIRDNNGAPIYMWAIIRDITERKKAEEALKQARDYLEEQVQKRTAKLEREVRDINALYNLNTKFIEGDDLNFILQELLNVAIRLTRADKGNIQLLDLSSNTLKIIVHNKYKTPFLKFFESVTPEKPSTCGTAMESLERIIVDDVTKSSIFRGTDALKVLLNEGIKAVQSTPIVSRNGELLGMISTHFSKVHKPAERELKFIDILARQAADIIKRKKAEEAIKAERQRFIGVMDILPAYLILLKPDYHVEYANRFFRERFGEDHGKRCYEYLFGLDEPCENCETYKVLKTNAPHHWEWIGPDGRNYDIYDFPFIDTDGSQLIMEFGIDITGRKKAEGQLQEIVKELERSNKELQSFAYITSHDLQEPLRTIASFTQLLERRYKGQLDSDADEFMDYIVSAAVRMKDMIQGLLEYSRVDTCNEPFKEFESEEAVNHALMHLHSSIEECNAEITACNLPLIFGDKHQITRVFLNLVGNALKFRREEVRPEIHISARKENGEYVFSVRDNGIGMERQYSKKIFEPFKRLHTTDVYEGAGIGLSIVKKIIENHGGRIWFESELGKGSVFYFTLPNH